MPSSQMTCMQSQSLGVAIVTGASSGIGTAYAEQLAERGYKLVLVARRRDRLELLAGKILSRYGVESEVVAADLTNKVHLTALEEDIAKRGDVSLLVNNAGSGAMGPTAQFDANRIEGLIHLNVVALARLSHAALAGFRIRGSGALINIGSIVSYGPSPIAATYTATKAFASNFTRSLQMEYRDSKIAIQLVQPGPVKTEFFEASQAPSGVFSQASFMTPEQLVRAALLGLDRGETVTTPSLADLTRWEQLERAQKEFLAGATSGLVASRYSHLGATPEYANSHQAAESDPVRRSDRR
jgi:short-subunit dehydrogenase